MATQKQKKALSKVVENGGNVTRAMRDAGYAEATVNNPTNLTASKGFQNLCEESGLTDAMLVDALVEDIRDKKGDRKAELELAFKIKGLFRQIRGSEEATVHVTITQWGSSDTSESMV